MDYNEIFNRNRIEWLYQAARSPKLSASAVRVGLLFATFVQPESRELLTPGYRWIMDNAHISKATLSKALKELEFEGFLTIERVASYRSHYSLPFNGDAVWKGPVQKLNRKDI